MSQYPEIFRVRQHFDAPRVTDVAAEVESQLSQLRLSSKVAPGQTVAITAGSRGIANIHLVLQAAVEHFRRLDARPFIVPAMGSHGGATAEGQRRVLEGYGITEEFCGCPIRSSMETVVVCQAAEGFPVHFDRNAFEADHVLVCGRVKPHTNFIGDLGSGLMKMMLIGLGKHAGAKVYHRAIHDYDFGQIVRSVAREVINRCSILAGLAILENGYHETARIVAVSPADFEAREKDLLAIARRLMPRLPFDFAHVLIIDEIGKDISGSGMDTNVVGRKYRLRPSTEIEKPEVRRIIVRGVTPASHGNALGIGLAEFCTSRVLEQADVHATRVNSLTSGYASAAMFPLDYPTDRDVLDVALPTVGLVEPADAKLLWIRNTLDLREVECSVAYLPEARDRTDLEILTQPRPLPFDDQGNLPGEGILAPVLRGEQAGPEGARGR